MNELETLKSWVENSNNVVFFGGAGVSTESDVPDNCTAVGNPARIIPKRRG